MKMPSKTVKALAERMEKEWQAAFGDEVFVGYAYGIPDGTPGEPCDQLYVCCDDDNILDQLPDSVDGFPVSKQHVARML